MGTFLDLGEGAGEGRGKGGSIMVIRDMGYYLIATFLWGSNVGDENGTAGSSWLEHVNNTTWDPWTEVFT